MDTIILCIGNEDGGDDGIGPYIAENLQSTEKQLVINAGTTPENHTSIIRKNAPKKVIIIDAIEMEVSPGEVRIVPEQMIGVMHISTHSTPLSVLINYIKTIVDDVILIGMQPLSYDGGLTNIVKKSGDNLIKILNKQDISSISKLQY